MFSFDNLKAIKTTLVKRVLVHDSKSNCYRWFSQKVGEKECTNVSQGFLRLDDATQAEITEQLQWAIHGIYAEDMTEADGLCGCNAKRT